MKVIFLLKRVQSLGLGLVAEFKFLLGLNLPKKRKHSAKKNPILRTANIPSVFSFAVDSKTLGPDKVSGNAYLNSAAKEGYTIHFYWMAICH